MNKKERLLDRLDKSIELGEITEKEAREILRDFEYEEETK